MYRFAILGAGGIARAMAKTVNHLRHEIEPYMVASRDPAKAGALASEFGFARSGNYEELYEDPAADIVYIATPHSHHFEQAKRCLESGKHVLCEKSFCANAVQSRELFELAEARGLFIGEAVWTRFLPCITKARELLASGVIGKIKSIHATFGADLRWSERLTQPGLAGGALLDLGIYTLTFADLFAPGNIRKIASCAIKTDAGVDATDAVEIEYDSGVMAMLNCSMTAPLPNRGVIFGELGRLELPNFWGGTGVELQLEGKPAEYFPCPFECNGYEYEVRAMIGAISKGETGFAELPHAKTLEIMTIMDGLRREWGVRFPFE